MEHPPIIINPNFNNAIYVRPNKGKLSKGSDSKKKDIERLANTDSGGIFLGASMYTPEYIAHEVGHSLDKSWLSSLAPKINSMWDKYHIPTLTTLAALGIGHYKPEYRTAAHMTNLGLNTLSSIPTLYSEYKATQLAKDVELPEMAESIDKSKLDDILRAQAIHTIANRIFAPAMIQQLDTYLFPKKRSFLW